MKKDVENDELEVEPLVDLTQSLKLHSKKLDRQHKKQRKRTGNFGKPKELLDLPAELLLSVLSFLTPREIFVSSQACRTLSQLVSDEELSIAKRVIEHRYSTTSKCLRLPVRIEDIPEHAIEALQDPSRQEVMAIHRKPYQHIPSAIPSITCTCLTCLLRWNSLCLVLDFSYWQNNLENGEPIPMIPRGTQPLWNQTLIERHSQVVQRALQRPLWYAFILESHLTSMVKAISRHSANKGNRRKRFELTPADMASMTDAFLDRHGPPTLEFPFHRDNYYMLETYMPSRGWSHDQKRWMYATAEQHDMDLQFVLRWRELRRAADSDKQKDKVSKEDAAGETTRRNLVTGTA